MAGTSAHRNSLFGTPTVGDERRPGTRPRSRSSADRVTGRLSPVPILDPVGVGTSRLDRWRSPDSQPGHRYLAKSPGRVLRVSAAIPVYWIVNIPNKRIDVYTGPDRPAETPTYAESAPKLRPRRGSPRRPRRPRGRPDCRGRRTPLRAMPPEKFWTPEGSRNTICDRDRGNHRRAMMPDTFSTRTRQSVIPCVL